MRADDVVSTDSSLDPSNRELWHTVFAVGHPDLRKFQRFHRLLPAAPRCRLCFAPFGSVGRVLMELQHKGPSDRNPHYCAACDKFITAFPGGAEVELSLAFVDLRDSTGLAERLSPTQYAVALRRFYGAANSVFYENDGFVMDLVGDGVLAVFPPGFSGPHHARKAVRASQILVDTKVPGPTPDGSIAFGVGVHTGVVFIGTVDAAPAALKNVGVAGDAVNTVARLASSARAGEALVTEASYAMADLATDLERREVELRGKREAVAVRVIRSGRESAIFHAARDPRVSASRTDE